MVKRRKTRAVLKFPARRVRQTKPVQERKLSEIIKEMALRLLKKPDAIPSAAAAEAALLLASAAWNSAVGDNGLRDRHRDMLERVDGNRGTPWAELASSDSGRLIDELYEYKQAHFPNDARRIVTIGMNPEGKVQVQWVHADKVVAAQFGSPGLDTEKRKVEKAHPIAEKLIARMKKEGRGKVVRFNDVIAGRAAAEELQKTVVSRERLADYRPAHAAYIYAQNQMSVLSEQLTALPGMAPFANLVSRAEDRYLPSGPPMSPLTASYFTCWAFFDACVGPASETIGTTTLEVGVAFGMHAELLRLIGLMQRSRMGIYVHEGTEGSLAVLREMVTDAVCRAIVPSGYRGKSGELWYVRVLPPPMLGGSEHVVFTTPYILLQPGIRDWQAYFRRTLPDAPKQARLDAYELHMKLGPTRAYWNDFVFEAYVNYRADAIFLAGLPDVPESQPHSKVKAQSFQP